MISNESASISRSPLPASASAFSQADIRDSHLICVNCKTTVAEDDLFCQECGATLIEARDEHEPAEQAALSRVGKLLALRNFDCAASAKRFAVLIAVVVVVGLSIFAVMAIAGSYDAMSEDYICTHAKKLLDENDSVQAAEILQRLYLARAQALKPQTLELLGQALLKRSDLYAGRNQVELAVKDLKSVPPGTAQAAIAAQKLLSLSPQAVPVVAVPEAIKSVVTEPVAAKAKVVLAPTPAAVGAKATVQAAKPAFATDDVANYNRLLATYFEKTGVESEQSAESGSSDEVAKTVKPVSEPPTLKEWVNAGRPDF